MCLKCLKYFCGTGHVKGTYSHLTNHMNSARSPRVLNRKLAELSFAWWVIPFAKTNEPQLAMSARELTLLLLTVFICKYTKVLWLCKRKGFHNNSFLRVY